MAKRNNKSASDGSSGAVLRKILINACCIFAITIFIVYTIVSISFGRAEFTTNLGNTAAIFALSFAASAAALVYKKIAFWKAHSIVFIVLGAIYYLIVVRIPRLHTDLGKTIVAMGLFIAAFAFATLIIILLKKRKNKSNNASDKDKDYQPKF